MGGLVSKLGLWSKPKDDSGNEDDDAPLDNFGNLISDVDRCNGIIFDASAHYMTSNAREFGSKNGKILNSEMHDWTKKIKDFLLEMCSSETYTVVHCNNEADSRALLLLSLCRDIVRLRLLQRETEDPLILVVVHDKSVASAVLSKMYPLLERIGRSICTLPPVHLAQNFQLTHELFDDCPVDGKRFWVYVDQYCKLPEGVLDHRARDEATFLGHNPNVLRVMSSPKQFKYLVPIVGAWQNFFDLE